MFFVQTRIMANLVIVLYLALFYTVLNVGAKDVAVPAKEITFQKEYLGEAFYAVPSDSSSELMEELSLFADQLEKEIYLTTDHLGTVYYTMSASPLSTLISCNLQRGNGTVYQLYPILEGNITDPNMKYKEDCGFEMSNFTVDNHGVWFLSTEFTDLMVENKSVTQPLVIIVEKEVDMIPKDFATVYEGENLFVEFSEIPDGYIDTCRLIGPELYSAEEVSERYHLAFGYNCSITFINAADDIAGHWTFRVDGNTTFIGRLHISVIPIPKVDNSPIDLQLGSSASLRFGPEDATYCRATDPMGLVWDTQNGPCSLELPAAGWEHDGQWNVQLGLPGLKNTRSYTYTVNVI